VNHKKEISWLQFFQQDGVLMDRSIFVLSVCIELLLLNRSKIIIAGFYFIDK